METRKRSILDIAYDDSKVVQQIHQLGVDASPNEACGVLFYSNSQWQIQPIPNRSSTPETQFSMRSEDILRSLGRWLSQASQEDLDSMAIWHTHPGGGIGPSRTDLKQRTSRESLVVAITPEGPKASVY